MRNKEGVFGPRKEAFRDFHFLFQRNPINNDVVTLSTDESIKQSVKLLITTMFYERPFQPKLGCRVYSALFESWSYMMVDNLRTDIKKFLAKYEPRIVVQDVHVSSENQFDGNELAVHIDYLVVGQVKNITQQISLRRVR